MSRTTRASIAALLASSVSAGAYDTTHATVDDALAVQIQQIIDEAMAPGAIAWNCCRLDLPPTGVVVGVRVPGRPDILLASGTDLDGDPLEPTAPFSTGEVGTSIVTQLGLLLIEDGTLDPDATIDAWLPGSPNADRITVRMLLDRTHGWAGFGGALLQHVGADLERRWTLGESLATVESLSPAAEPGTFALDGATVALVAVAYIAEQVTGATLAELFESYIAKPNGLDASLFSDGSDLPDGYRHGLFTAPGIGVNTTAQLPLTAYFTFAPTEDAFVSNTVDLLNLLDAWSDGSWSRTGTPPTPAFFPDERDKGLEYPGDRGGFIGHGVPYNGYCPCEPATDGNTVDAIGRQPWKIGTDLQMLHFIDDDVSIVLQFNSDQWVDRNQLEAVLDDIRAAVAASR